MRLSNWIEKHDWIAPQDFQYNNDVNGLAAFLT
jgi:hypothetical protein